MSTRESGDRSNDDDAIDTEYDDPVTSIRSQRGNIEPPPEDMTHYRLLAHYSILVLASMAGCLIRLGLTAMGTYAGASIFPIAWSQGVGCAIMGLALARKKELTFWPPIFTFWTTGIAASITTFSTWMEEGYLAFADFNGYRRSGFYDAVDGIVYTFATFAIALACLYFGEYVASILPHLPRRALPSVATENSKGSTRRRKPSQHPLLDTIAIISAILCYLIALILYFYTPTTWRHRAIFPILLSPSGTMLRYALSRLNAHYKFPLGTFLANMIATIALAGVFAEQHRIGSGVRCNAMYSIQQGFCGCLSTVSSFAVEVRALKGWMKWIYIGASVVGGHILMLVVFGGVGWSKGYGPICTE